MRNLKVGDFVDFHASKIHFHGTYNATETVGWRPAIIRRSDEKSGQVQVCRKTFFNKIMHMDSLCVRFIIKLLENIVKGVMFVGPTWITPKKLQRLEHGFAEDSSSNNSTVLTLILLVPKT